MSLNIVFCPNPNDTQFKMIFRKKQNRESGKYLIREARNSVFFLYKLLKLLIIYQN